MPRLRQRVLASITRRYPFLSGCGTIANSRFIRSLGGESAETVWVRLASGKYVQASLNDYVGRAAYYFGDLDRKITNLCRKIVRRGDTVLDIGANIGIVTLNLASMVGPRGQVHAFEPNLELQVMLEAAVKKNNLNNVTIHGIALGAEEGPLELSIPFDNQGAGSLVNKIPVAFRKILVPVRRLSNILAELNTGPIRFVKVDVEGYELEVFNGAREWFQRSPPDTILFEANGEPDRGRGGWKILQELGYHFFGIPKALYNMRLCAFDPDGLGGACHDVLAVHLSAKDINLGL